MEYPGELETEKIVSAWLWRDFISNLFVGIYYSMIAFQNSKVQWDKIFLKVFNSKYEKKVFDREESRFPANFCNFSNWAKGIHAPCIKGPMIHASEWNSNIKSQIKLKLNSFNTSFPWK